MRLSNQLSHCAGPESAERIPAAPKIPEGVRFAAAYVLCAGPESAERIPAAPKIPEGVRFAAACALAQAGIRRADPGRAEDP